MNFGYKRAWKTTKKRFSQRETEIIIPRGRFFCRKVLLGSILDIGRGPNVTPNFHLGLGKVEDQRLEHAPCRISPFHSAPWPHFLRFEWNSGSNSVPHWWQNAVITKIFTKIANGLSWLFAHFPDLLTRIENMRDCALGGGKFPRWPNPTHPACRW